MRDALRAARTRAGTRPMVIVNGTARGADALARHLAHLTSNAQAEDWPALWQPSDPDAPYDRHARNVRGARTDRGAGYKRNAAMVAAGADEALAFLVTGAGNRGSRHCAELCEAAGIPLTYVEMSASE